MCGAPAGVQLSRGPGREWAGGACMSRHKRRPCPGPLIAGF
jgi:hypothetical protein